MLRAKFCHFFSQCFRMSLYWRLDALQHPTTSIITYLINVLVCRIQPKYLCRILAVILDLTRRSTVQCGSWKKCDIFCVAVTARYTYSGRCGDGVGRGRGGEVSVTWRREEVCTMETVVSCYPTSEGRRRQSRLACHQDALATEV